MRADVTVVGGGVAGSSLASALARAGLGVVVVEREQRFRDRVRGEALHPWGAAEVAALGLVDALEGAGARRLPIWQTYHERVPNDPYRWADDMPDDRLEWGVPHPRLQEALLARAERGGATVLRPAEAVAARQAGDGVDVTVVASGQEVSVRSRILVGADGRRSGVRRWIGAETLVDPPHHEIGGVLLERVEADRERAHVATWAGGMALLFPQQERHARAYLVRGIGGRNDETPPAARITAACAERFPEGFLSSAVAAGPAGFFSCSDIWPTVWARGRMVLVGDAAGANDPAQGHGLSLSFHDARVLRDLLLDGDDWDHALRAFARHREAVFGTLRAHARWCATLTVDQGAEADSLRERVRRAREQDPSAAGFAGIYAFGPVGLVADEAARRAFFGEAA